MIRKKGAKKNAVNFPIRPLEYSDHGARRIWFRHGDVVIVRTFVLCVLGCNGLTT
jgi:hypothetical protein